MAAQLMSRAVEMRRDAAMPSLRTVSAFQKASSIRLVTSNILKSWAAGLTSDIQRSEEHTSELQSLMSTSYAVFCLKKKNKIEKHHRYTPVKTSKYACNQNTENKH